MLGIAEGGRCGQGNKPLLRRVLLIWTKRKLLCHHPTVFFICVAIVMSLYALDDDLLIYAADAVELRSYRCSGCGSIVRVRKGRHRTAHFYHISSEPSCRLYSKSEDHLLAQLALQRALPLGETVMEKPFVSILRVGDLVWEPRRLVFEIQCSLVSPAEVERRVHDYSEVGYQVVWILDDRIFNRRYKLRAAERQLRQTACYYATLRRSQMTPRFYDQFEVFHGEQRLGRGSKSTVHLNQPRILGNLSWNDKEFPMQVLQRVNTRSLYFEGDLVHKALLAAAVPALAVSMRNLRALEILLSASAEELGSPFKRWVRRYVLESIGRIMLYLLERAER